MKITNTSHGIALRNDGIQTKVFPMNNCINLNIGKIVAFDVVNHPVLGVKTTLYFPFSCPLISSFVLSFLQN